MRYNLYFILTIYFLNSCSISKKTHQERFGNLEKTGEFDSINNLECETLCNKLQPRKNGNLIFVYNGTSAYNPYVVSATLEIPSEEKVWAKQYSDEHRDSIWCLVYPNPQIIQYQAVIDTHKVKDFEIYNDKLEFEQIEVSLPTICDEDQTEYFYYQLSLKLYKEGYLSDKHIYTKMLPSIKLALTNYQLDNNLCSGAINMETLTVLDLKSY
ncbi:hypothetical protein [Portibacter lacus]|uniref:Uncharacterized protein n=1 Tax=Portibacter lacus TaxID=1099794 RepID=A0AA37WDY0_9BACT|nr:hypothetical protein [Portibacter lacus]GLR18311.1 hypothetical protein GCM10007940_29270 [Portibacter lacus]